MAYKLTLTAEDWRTIEFVGGRYCWSMHLLEMLGGEPEPDDDRDDTIDEAVAWSLVNAFEADVEGGHGMFPMLAPDLRPDSLYRKLEKFYVEVV